VYLLVAVVLGLTLLFAVRFLRRGTATEAEPTIASHSPADKSREHGAAAHREQGGSAKKEKQSVEEMPPDRIVRDLVNTWNKGNADQIARLFMSDGTLVIPSGSQIQSRGEIEKTISEKRAGILKETTLSNTVDEVRQPDPDTALVNGTYKLDGIRIMGISTSATGSYKLRQVKRDGRWLISRAELIGHGKD
jgi:uncharacterized protein (TIGR02246 family)